MAMEALKELAPAESVRKIDFEQAEVVSGFIPDTYFLVVRGEAPCLNMRVSLLPLIYIRCPGYWGIEVVGSVRGGFCLEAMKPYVVAIPLAGIIGSKGIEVISAHRSKRFDVPGGCRP